jgi:Uma2 family endonuclease
MSFPHPPSARVSVQEYFRLADASETKLEFKSGELINMAGASLSHIRISGNALVEPRNRLKGKKCEAVGGDLRVKAGDDRYCYPDLAVFCGKPEFDPLDPDRSLTNPTVLVEVLSPSTEAADRGEKFIRYIRLPSLREYVLVSRHKPRIETFVRQPDGSRSVGEIAEGLSASLRLRSLNLDLPLADLYANVEFEPTIDQA